MNNIQKQIQTLLNEAVSADRERGVQIAVYFEGELVIDAAAGFADPAKRTPAAGDTLFPVFSATKGLAATMLHILAEQGKVDYDTPIAAYWPEFGVNGKDKITVRHALTHSAGLPNMPAGLGPKDLCDWDRMCRAIAQLRPIWEPGSKSEYHAITYSWLVGEVMRRADGRSFAGILDEEICRPLRIGEMYVGLPASLDSRVAILECPDFNPDLLKTPDASPIPGWIWPLHAWMNTREARRACVPASNGIMSARALARHYAALMPGGVGGVELLPPKRIRLATRKSAPLGYGLGGGKASIMGPRCSAFGHAGYSGANGFADPKYRFAFAYTKNLLGLQNNPLNQLQIANQIRNLLGIPGCC